MTEHNLEKNVSVGWTHDNFGFLQKSAFQQTIRCVGQYSLVHRPTSVTLISTMWCCRPSKLYISLRIWSCQCVTVIISTYDDHRIIIWLSSNNHIWRSPYNHIITKQKRPNTCYIFEKEVTQGLSYSLVCQIKEFDLQLVIFNNFEKLLRPIK